MKFPAKTDRINPFPLMGEMLWIVLGILLALPGGADAAFKSLERSTFTASATVSGTPSLDLRITIDPLPDRAFFGKNVVVPIEVSSSQGTLDPKSLVIEIIFKLRDRTGQSDLGVYEAIPVLTALNPTLINTLRGTAIIQRSKLLGIRRGGFLNYFFRVRQSGVDTVLTRSRTFSAPAGSPESSAPSDPFTVEITDTFGPVPVGPQGTVVRIPDLFVNDGRTSVRFDAGALSNPGTLTVRQEDADAWPVGPGGQRPVEVFSFDLRDTSLLRLAHLTFSYPSEGGKVLDGDGRPSGNPLDLAPYWWDSFEWRVLAKPTIDTTLHTVMAPTAHFSTFALIPTGPVASAALRAPQRIITPNGDGYNDFAIFENGIDEVRLFDVRGRRVRTLAGPRPVWDGKDDDGQVVESGVYLYQFTSDGERISGVITVAK